MLDMLEEVADEKLLDEMLEEKLADDDFEEDKLLVEDPIEDLLDEIEEANDELSVDDKLADDCELSLLEIAPDELDREDEAILPILDCRLLTEDELITAPPESLPPPQACNISNRLAANTNRYTLR